MIEKTDEIRGEMFDFIGLDRLRPVAP